MFFFMLIEESTFFRSLLKPYTKKIIKGVKGISKSAANFKNTFKNIKQEVKILFLYFSCFHIKRQLFIFLICYDNFNQI